MCYSQSSNAAAAAVVSSSFFSAAVYIYRCTHVNAVTHIIYTYMRMYVYVCVSVSLSVCVCVSLFKILAKKWGYTEIAERGRSVLVMRASYRSARLTPHQRGWTDAG